MKWQPENGKAKELCEIDDIHLANIHYHVRYYAYPKITRDEIIAEVQKRGLKDQFLANAPYPYVDARDGLTKIWSFEKKYSVPVKKEPKKTWVEIEDHANKYAGKYVYVSTKNGGSNIHPGIKYAEYDGKTLYFVYPDGQKEVSKVWSNKMIENFIDKGIWIRVDNPKIKSKPKHGWVLKLKTIGYLGADMCYHESVKEALVYETRDLARRNKALDDVVIKVELDDSGRATKIIK